MATPLIGSPFRGRRECGASPKQVRFAIEERIRVNYFTDAELDPMQRNAVESKGLKSVGGAILCALVIGLVWFLVFGGDPPGANPAAAAHNQGNWQRLLTKRRRRANSIHPLAGRMCANDHER